MSQNAINTNTDRPEPTCLNCQNPGHYRNQCHLLRRQKKQAAGIQNNHRNNQITLSRLTGTNIKKQPQKH